MWDPYRVGLRKRRDARPIPPRRSPREPARTYEAALSAGARAHAVLQRGVDGELSCDCAIFPVTPEGALSKSAAVVEVQVMEASSPDAGRASGAVPLKVLKGWKGAKSGDVLRFATGESSCDYRLEPGETYIIAGHLDSEGFVSARQCDGAANVWNSEELASVREALERGQKAAPAR